ncbi:PilZ domain-containing protein [Rhizobium bangladeshense]|uniref:PilZ domain-containing protein n=1 Tax=Rhizobium bangladeshense TaxID=1138189 RepID=UPI001C83B0CA|nr:PilZ domain-containing protein [Rhizobium bangladeshense]MBX4889939.1 PilZ domain-containing protein [Rhizobium bangladeshense]MBX4895553.1 PilZ domain-containing protein [Rhizobium bangladeshense]MBX4901524.1 PilZ domain-containing protein [Rhizobium bangladeshense]MBX4920834.1 PilZ domain-containing protein [Rhizobium bangladeshense]MBY3616246.1 PilZ domain-containing protein [Rhizobium bangladeshense]
MSRNLKIMARKTDRKNCRVFGSVKYLNSEVDVRILNLSATGAALETKEPLQAASGSKVRIEAENLGLLEGIIRWKHNGRIGIQFDVNSNARAQISSYFRFFHKEIRPVLAVRQLATSRPSGERLPQRAALPAKP